MRPFPLLSRADTRRPGTTADPRSTRPGRMRTDLEGLRAIAVLGVVVYHLRPGWLPGGFAGVDVFFVLSGFFITGLLLREVDATGRVDLRAFWGRRARRLLPAAAFVLVGTVLAGMVLVDPIDARRFAQDGVWTSLFSVNWHYAQQGTSYLADTDPSPLTHFWSLGVEEQFYVVWPVLLAVIAFAVARRRPRWAHGAVGVLALGTVVTSFLIAWSLTAGLQPYAYFATYSRVWQLGLGGLIAASAVALGRLPLMVRTAARWVGVATIVGFYLRAPLDIVYPGWIAAVPTLAAALIVASGLPRTGARAVTPAVASARDPLWRTLGSRPSQFLGRYSYGWYLWHYPPLVLLPLVVNHALTPFQLVVTALAALACAVVSYHVLEHPVRSAKPLARHRGQWSLALGAVLILTTVTATAGVDHRSEQLANAAKVTTASGVALTPSPAVAAAEQNQTTADGCQQAADSDQASPECRYLPDQGSGDVVLVGDSHAAQWMPAVKSAAAANDWGLRVWTRSDCPFADVTKTVNGAPNTACDTWRADTVQRIVAAKPSLVVVSSYPPPGGDSLYDRDTGTSVTDTADAKALYLAGMERELAVLTAAGIPTLLIDDVPRFDQIAAKCVLQHSDDLAACSAPQATAEHAPIDAAAAKAAGVSSLDLTDVFCRSDRCYQVIGSTIAYRDNNHLTHEMVATLTPRVTSAMLATLAAAAA